MRGVRLYGALLRAYPAAFRRRYGAEMVDLFERMAEEPRYRGPGGTVRLWGRVAGDLAASAARQQWRSAMLALDERARRRERRSRTRRKGMTSWLDDLWNGARTLRRRPAMAAAAAVTLALGVGANAAVFSVVNGLMFQPLPVPDADRLVSLARLDQRAQPADLGSMSYPEFRAYRALPVFESAAAFTLSVAQFGSEGQTPDRVMIEPASPSLFETLRLEPRLGRSFRSTDDGGGADPVVVLSHAFWERRFGGDSRAVGAPVQLNGQPFTVIGVLPEKFHGHVSFIDVDAYIPAATQDLLNPSAIPAVEDWTRFGYRVVARLSPGVTLGEARAAATVAAERLAKERPGTQDHVSAVVHPEPLMRLEPAAASYFPPLAAVFMLLVSLVLLIACANLANLLLVQASGRRKEMAVRAALGSGRFRIARQLLAEGLWTSVAGAAGGVLLARLALQALAHVRIATDLPIRMELHLDWRVFAFALGAAVVASLLASLAPAFYAFRTDLVVALREGGRGSGHSGGGRLRGFLVAGQVAVSLVLLVTAGLFIVSTRNVATQDFGFRTQGLLLASVDVDLQRYDEVRGRAFFRDLIERVRGLPGVRSASEAVAVPISVTNFSTTVRPEGSLDESESGRSILCNMVGPGYFETMDVPILSGRAFDERDAPDSQRVAIVNDVLAEQLWPGRSALGQRLVVEEGAAAPLEVVGVARRATYNLPGEAPAPYVYLPLAQSYSSFRVLHVQTDGDPAALAAAVRGAVGALDPEMPVFDVRTMRNHLRQGKGTVLLQLASGLVGSFGLIGAALACLGLYGAMAYSVSQRRHEMGVRMTLGASTGRLFGLVLRRGLGMAGAGIAAGTVMALASTRVFTNLLVGVGPNDPVVFGSVAAILAAVGLVAVWLPARRATRVDPVEVLRSE